MMPKPIQVPGLLNNGKVVNNFSHSSIFGRFQNEKNNSSVDQLSLNNDGFSKPKSPIVLKRSSLIKYEECVPFADANDDICRITKEITEDKPEKIEKLPLSTLFKTGSISSLKISSLKEQWPSSEYVTSGRCKVRTQSTCDEHRTRLPTTTSNGNVADHSSSTVPRSITSGSSHSNLNLTLSSDRAVLSSCLSKCDAASKYAAAEIMQLMNFTDMSLVESLQNFIIKVPVIGESQERDRILTYFTDRFMECNPGAFKHNDSCHTLVCALMLLNTDIHGQVSKKRMTCKEFVDNILINYKDNDYKENDLINVYNFIRKCELKSDEPVDNTNTLRRKLSKLINKSIRPPPEINSVNIDSDLLNQQHFISGNIMRKCIKRSFGKKPALGHRGWKLQFASLIGLQLLLFKTNLNKNDGRVDQDDSNVDRISLTDSNISSELLQNDDSSLCMSINNPTKSNINSKLPSSCSRENVQVSVDDVESCIKIHHALASIVEKLRHKNVFSLRLADQAEYFFKVKSDQLHTWVNSINRAAAVLSAPPIIGAGQCGLYKPLLPGYLTDLDKTKQIESHEIQIRHYKESLKKLQLVHSKTRAINEPNIQFCRYEISRFEAYLKLLSSSTTDLLTNDHSHIRHDLDSNLSIMEPHIHNSITTQSTLLASLHTSPTTSTHDITTLRRRPPKVPIVSHSHSISRPSHMSPSTHNDSVQTHSPSTAATLISQCHIPLPPSSTRPIPYSPQLPSHFTFSRSAGIRPTPSFSRFIEPSFVTDNCQRELPQILSPLTTARSQHSCQPSYIIDRPTSNQLPEYSPPSSRHNINKV